MSEESKMDIKVLREKQELVKEASEHLSQITSIGNPTILIEKTKLIIHASKQLLQGFDELTVNKTSSYITMLVSNTKIIAADPTVVTAEAIKSLSRSRDKLLNQLTEINSVLEQKISGGLYDSLYRSRKDSDLGGEDKEREQLEQLAKQRGELRAKKSVQQAFILEGDPATMLEEVVSEFLSSTKCLEESYVPGNNPSRSEILLSLCGIASSVLRLLDLIDSLFVSKFPMRKQVYTFTEKLIELGMAYKPVDRKGGREGDAISDMRKQLPALQNSAKVMLAQLEERVRNLTASRQRSMKRRQDLSLIGSREVDQIEANFLQTLQEDDYKLIRCLHLRLICHVCCTSAKQASNGEPIKRGSVLRLEVSGDASIRELKEQLSKYTGIPVKYVLPRFPGVNQPTNNEIELGELFEGGDMRDVFLFDLSSSEGLPEDELRELRRLAVAQMSIDDFHWAGEWAGDIAQATVDYDVTEPGHLSFIEGELLKVLERSSDGWWKGEVNRVQGIFYKTFVQELHRETSSSVPTNYKQVAFTVKKKESYLTKKKSEEEPPVSSSMDKKSTAKYLTHQDGGDQTQKKASHFSIELDEHLDLKKNLSSVPEDELAEPKVSDLAMTDRVPLQVRDKDNSYERKLSNRLNSLDIDELIDQLSEYSGIPVPETPTEPCQPNKHVPCGTNSGFEPVSPVDTDMSKNYFHNTSGPHSSSALSTCNNSNTIFPSNTTSAVNPLIASSSEFGQVYDSLLGVEASSKLEARFESDNEDNLLYEKVETVSTDELEEATDKLKQDTTVFSDASSSYDHSESALTSSKPPPIPTSTRPPKTSAAVAPPPSLSTLVAKPKSKPALGKKGKLSVKSDKEKKRRNFFGWRQKTSDLGSSIEDVPPSKDSDLPPVPAPENNASSNNSNPNPLFEFTFTKRHSADGIYEQVDQHKTSRPKQVFIQSQQNDVSSRQSHYEQVDLMTIPPPSNNEPTNNADDVGPQISVGDHMYSQIELRQNSIRKTASVEETQKITISTDESSHSVKDTSENSTFTQSLPSPDGQLSPGIKSYPIYSQITRKRDSIIIHDDGDQTPVAVNLNPEKDEDIETGCGEKGQENDTRTKSRPILPPTTLTIEDVEVYINDKGDQDTNDAFYPSPTQTSKKRLSHYQEVGLTDSPPLPRRTLSHGEYYEEVEGNRPRIHSTPQRIVEQTVKTPLQTSHSAAHVHRAKDNELPPIPPPEPDLVDAYESIETVMGVGYTKQQSSDSNKINQVIAPVRDVKDLYVDTLLICISNLIQIKVVNCTLFTKDAQQTKKMIKSLEIGQPLSVDFTTPPAVLASLIKQILKPERIGPLFSVLITEQLLYFVKNDKELLISGHISSVSRELNKFIRDFIYLLYLNLNDLSEKKKQEFIVSLAPLFFQDASKKNMDTCKHILRYLVEHYTVIFQN